MSLTVVTFLYGLKWAPHYVDKLFSGLRRNIRHPFRCALVSDRRIDTTADINVHLDVMSDAELLTRPGCLVRMRLFDRKVQSLLDVKPGDRIVNIDVDAVITGNLDPLFDRDDEFTIMQHFNSTNPCPFNGSLWMFRAGERHDVWDDFSLDKFAPKGPVPVHAIPDDQGWLHSKFPNAKAYTPADGVYCFKKRTWPGTDETGNKLPTNAIIVAFPGRDPARFTHLDWVARNWR